jgi:hypothetical protein
MRHTLNLLAVTVEINPKKPHDARLNFHCREDTMHFLMSRETLETVQDHIAIALAKVPFPESRKAKAN